MVAHSPPVKGDPAASPDGRLTGVAEALAREEGRVVAPAAEARSEQGALIPALLRSYRNLETIRHDYPVVLLDAGADATIAPLADLIDGLLRRIDPATRDVEALRRHLYRLETRVKRLSETEPGAPLSTLWASAATLILEGIADEGRRATLGQELEAAHEALDHDGAVLPCRPDAARRLVEHAWRRLRAEQAAADAGVLADLSGRISDLIDAERAQAPEAITPTALAASMAGERSGVNFEALSKLLGGARLRARPNGRARGLREPLRVLEAERERLTVEAVALSAPVFETCTAALAASHADGVKHARVLRAVRLATLALESRYRGERHGRSVALHAGELTPDERRVLPPLLVSLDADQLADGDWAEILAILGSEVPLKILVAIHRLFGEQPGSPAGGSDWGKRIAETALLASEAFVVQASVSQLPRMAATVTAALRHEGPALIALYVGPSDRRGPGDGPSVPTYARCAAAVESRAFPSFVSDPGAGTDWFARLSLVGDPQPDVPWPRHRLTYEDAEGGSVEEDVAFTIVDLLALESSLRRHFELVAQAEWSARMVPVADLLGEPSGLIGALPFIYVVGASDRLYRGVVSPDLLALGRASAANWARLQALARAGAPTAGAATPGPSIPTEEATVAEPGGATPPSAETTEPTATAPAPGVAYIETALCTTCDDCTGRNPRMFAYNAAKQAFVQDVRAGTYRELVEAAENCPVCIIHPGRPLDPSEPGLEGLITRAASFA